MRLAATGLVLLPLLLGLQTSVLGAEIYTCVDSQGRKLTADRPIPECMDRQQLQLNSSGTVKSKVMPVPTAQEKAAQEQKDRQIAEQQQLENDEKRRNRALVLRYPNQAVHDKERATALAMVDELILSAHKRHQTLAVERKAMDSQLEFYVANPAKVPPALKRSLDANQSSALEQQKFIISQGDEKKRVNQRFDNELAQLRLLWAAAGTRMAPKPDSPTPPTAASSAY